MMQGCENVLAEALPRPAPRITYRRGDARAALAEAGTLAVFGFGSDGPAHDDPRWLRVALHSLDPLTPLELWLVDAPVSRGRTGAVCWASGGGWLFAAIELDEAPLGGAGAAAAHAYDQLRRLVEARAEHHVLRVWNYLDAINQGEGDAERYKQFCEGRAAGMGSFFAEGFPAATAIGHHGPAGRLQVYLLACDQPGARVENPRQVSAWCYPRQYGRTPPSFARAMLLPSRDTLAISGTAAVVGHASAHEDDLRAQLEETLTNLEALLGNAGVPAAFNARSPLKVYLRHPQDAAQVRQSLQHRLPGVPLLLLHGDICRSELLVEIDGWRHA
jgi:chorismate lyase/3-hydroxybenzoate synthase